MLHTTSQAGGWLKLALLALSREPQGREQPSPSCRDCRVSWGQMSRNIADEVLWRVQYYVEISSERQMRSSYSKTHGNCSIIPMQNASDGIALSSLF